MVMTRIEKRFVNRKRKAQRNIDKVDQRLKHLDVQKIHRVLELGCGIGAVSAYLADRYQMSVYGTDFDPEQIEIARRMYPENNHLRFGIEDASNLSCEDNQFDLGISQNVFHHIPSWKNAVREVGRVLRPVGYFIWFDLSFPKWVTKALQPLDKKFGIYTIDDIKLEFTKNGFVELYYRRLLHGIFPHHHLVLEKR